MIKFATSFLRDDSGASAAEYALILAIVGTGIALAAFNLGGAIGDAMDTAKTCISTSGGATQPTC
ncbi:MAG: Flp family type IVb pilin [Pseudomonadota bacterium]